MNNFNIKESKVKNFSHKLCSFVIKFAEEPLVKITCTLIAAIAGGIIGASFQDNTWREQNKLSMMESDRKQAEEVFNEVSSLMDDRYYKTRRLLSAYFNNDSIKIQVYHQSLVSQLEEWNANKNRLNSLLEAYYGKKYSDYFMYRIQNPFAKIANTIIYTKIMSDENLNSIRNDLSKIDSDIVTFNKMLLDVIINNKVGRYSEERNNDNK